MSGMPVQYGKCSNRGGCSLAYTGETIRFEGEPRCPECGQTLAIQQPPRSAKRGILIVSGLLLLILGAGGAGAYLYFQSHQGSSASPPSTPRISEAETDEPANPPPPDAKGPALVETNATELPPDVAKLAAPPPASPPPAIDQSSVAPPNPDAFPSEQSAIAEVPSLSKAEVDATRSDVLKRISAMPKMGAQEKERLAEKVETARSMERLQVVRFDLGKTTLPKSTADQLATIFNKPEMKNRLSDPTLVFVVAGYADSGGDANSNLRISQDRADSVGKFLKQQMGILNVVHTIGMGSTNLLDGKRPDQNRAAEIWAVVP
jgi:outer membrane protein OmpA-like peptidoglycan-associated protein